MQAPQAVEPAVERPLVQRGVQAWLRRNLFRTPLDSLLTVAVAAILLSLLNQFLNWAFADARWSVVTDNLRVLMIGIYPLDQIGRITFAVICITALGGASWGLWGKPVRSAAIALFGAALVLLVFPVIERSGLGDGIFEKYLQTQLLPLFDVLREPVLILITLLAIGYLAGYALRRFAPRSGGRLLIGLWLASIPMVLLLVRGTSPDSPLIPLVPTSLWGGLLLTFMLAFVAMVFCFPLGILLALGRASGGRARRGERGLRGWLRAQGSYPVIKIFCTLYIEFIRGVPLVAVLFTANLLVPLALGNAEIDSVVRSMFALTLFEAAYVAEIVRGGLQGMPAGQLEAAKALGLNPVLATFLITLPQALRIVIPSLVGQFITLFKDTSLVAIVGLLDLIGIGQSVVTKAEYSGRQREIYVFIAIVYFVCSFALSVAARQLERSGSGRIRNVG